jgi:hypothetical protein
MSYREEDDVQHKRIATWVEFSRRLNTPVRAIEPHESDATGTPYPDENDGEPRDREEDKS